MQSVADTDKAYLAGLVDGEGSVMLVRNRLAGIVPKVAIYNTKRSLLEWCVTVVGEGSIQCQRKGGNRKDCFSAVWQHRQAVRILRWVLPYLKIKREQADIASRVYEFDEATRECARLSVKELNRKGR